VKICCYLRLIANRRRQAFAAPSRPRRGLAIEHAILLEAAGK
jgi:hypothetical protein